MLRRQLGGTFKQVYAGHSHQLLSAQASCPNDTYAVRDSQIGPDDDAGKRWIIPSCHSDLRIQRHDGVERSHSRYTAM
jgi:hypothetical protein